MPAPRKPSRKVTDADRAYIRELHTQGLGRNEIAAKSGFGAATITKVCKELGLDFNRAATAAAVAARQIDLADLRTKAAERALIRLHRIHDRLDQYDTDQAFTYRISTGKGVETVTDTHIPADHELKFAQAIASHERTAAHASPVATDTDLPAVDAWLAHMAGDGS